MILLNHLLNSVHLSLQVPHDVDVLLHLRLHFVYLCDQCHGFGMLGNLVEVVVHVLDYHILTELCYPVVPAVDFLFEPLNCCSAFLSFAQLLLKLSLVLQDHISFLVSLPELLADLAIIQHLLGG